MPMRMKKCASCHKTLEEKSFAKNASTRDGLQSYCRPCVSEKNKKRRDLFGDKIRQNERALAEKHRQARKERCAQWASKNIERKRASARDYYWNNRDAILQYKAEYRANNYPKIAVRNGSRRAREAQATPKWADKKAMAAIYKEARRLSNETGIAHHVDHIIPLKGEFVSGLHTHQNLQIITASENMRKRNSF